MLKPGSRWKSQVCTTEAVLVRPPKAEGTPECGGVAMVPHDQPAGAEALQPGFDCGSAVGKRYRDEQAGIEMLCTKAGAGALGFAGVALAPVEAKKLPSSD